MIIGPNVNLTNLKTLTWNMDFSNLNLDGVDLTGSYLNVGITSGGITGTPILPSGYVLVDGYIIGPGITFSTSVFTNANLSGLDLSNMNLEHVSFEGANLTGVNLSNSSIGWVDFKDTTLTNLKAHDVNGISLIYNLPTGYRLMGNNIIGAGPGPNTDTKLFGN